MSKPNKRHALSTRIWHWVTAISVIILFMSGLNISNAHPRLYWGEWGFMPEQAWLELPRFPGEGGYRARPADPPLSLRAEPASQAG